MAGRGGAIPGAGRKKGVPNKATREIKEICRGYGPEMIEALVRLAKGAQSEAARVAAIKEVLDRAYGKSVQKLAGDDKEPPIKVEDVSDIEVAKRIAFLLANAA